jgi:transposase-like protein
MTHKTVLDVPDGMQKIYRLFERWRSSQQGRLPIPKTLWASAAEVAREHGVFRTAKILRLEYAKLKRMTKSAAPAVKRRTASPAEFLELVSPQVAPSGSGLTECVIELEGPRGKMRVQWRGAAAPDLAGLSRGLWEPA